MTPVTSLFRRLTKKNNLQEGAVQLIEKLNNTEKCILATKSTLMHEIHARRVAAQEGFFTMHWEKNLPPGQRRFNVDEIDTLRTHIAVTVARLELGASRADVQDAVKVIETQSSDINDKMSKTWQRLASSPKPSL